MLIYILDYTHICPFLCLKCQTPDVHKQQVPKKLSYVKIFRELELWDRALNKVCVNVNEASYLKGTAGTTNTSPLDNQTTDMIHRPMCSVSLSVSLIRDGHN